MSNDADRELVDVVDGHGHGKYWPVSADIVNRELGSNGATEC